MLHIKPIESRHEAQDIATVRNSGREFMTHNSEYITPVQQAEWFQFSYVPQHMLGNMHAFIGYEQQTPVAYGMVNRIDEDFWVTGVIADQKRGKGRGEHLFRYLSEYTLNFLAERVLLDVLKDNTPAIKLYKKLGYTALTEDKGCLVMCLDKENYKKGSHEPQLTNVL